LVTTILNPRSGACAGTPAAGPYGLQTASLGRDDGRSVTVIGWQIAIVAALERGLREAGRTDLIYRLSSGVLVVMAAAMGAQTLCII